MAMELHELLQQCRRNKVTAQKCVYDRFAAMMFLLCRRYVRTDQEAEEVMMNGFLKFLRSLNEFEYVSDASTVAWIKRLW